ncbi:hypothetical protein [Sporosarcina aquimarina]|uniref:DUF4340 domain-containing protein n=1 Tax=Sporosarcina aquimarina TaxID=114975 RepID=A0ABU4G1N6_9BACL|nr:hypothetical protein [Sporosarcina aquimarina]MDW0110879.1 hypothetical protein [Sporosarcina aquimarina]
MKALGIIVGALLVSVVVYAVVNKSYYPSLPVENLTSTEVIEKLKNSDEEVVEIAEENGATWFITESGGNGVLSADEAIKDMMKSAGWTFTEKLGAGLFFEKENLKTIVTTQMWTEKYVIIQVQKEFKES